MMKGNMADAEKGLRQNRGQGLRVRLAEMLVTNFFSKSHTAYFSVLIFIAVSNISSFSMHLKHGALCNKFVSLGIERQFLKMETV